MAILQTPNIIGFSPFDPKYDYFVSFTYTDSQPMKNRAVITDNSTSAIVYDQKQDSMKLSHTISANTLKAGHQYLIQIQVFDADGNSSNLSDPILFYCFTNPILKFSNITDGQIYKNASISLSLSYSQSENEPLRSFRFLMYDYTKTLLKSSDVLYSSSTKNYTFYALENNMVYYFRAIGETSHGIKLDSGYVQVDVQFNTVPANIVFQVENIFNEGYIQLKLNIKDIGYELENNNYTLKDGLLTLNDNSINYNDGFEIDDDFSLFVEAKLLPISKFLQTNNGNISLSIINVCDTYYCKLAIKDSDFVQFISLPKARLSDNLSNIITDDNGNEIEIINTSYEDNELVVFEVKRENGYYSLNSYYKAENLV